MVCVDSYVASCQVSTLLVSELRTWLALTPTSLPLDRNHSLTLFQDSKQVPHCYVYGRFDPLAGHLFNLKQNGDYWVHQDTKVLYEAMLHKKMCSMSDMWEDQNELDISMQVLFLCTSLVLKIGLWWVNVQSVEMVHAKNFRAFWQEKWL